MARAARLDRIRGLYGIVDDDPRFARDLLSWASALAQGGASAVQLRFKHTASRDALALARRVRTVLPSCLLIIDDRPDLALLCDADGVHLGDEDLSPFDARQLMGPDRLVGATARDSASGRRLLESGADHLGVGPIFETRTKAVGHPPLGLAGLRLVCREVEAPVVAIAGIDGENIAAVAATGARAAAVIGAVGRASDPAAMSATLVREFERGLSGR